MPRPQTKQELSDIIESEREKLDRALTGLTDAEMEMPGVCGDWSVKDILAHLVDWEQRCLGWYQDGLRGEVPKTPDENFNWRELPALNQAINEKYQNWPLEEVWQAYQHTYQETISKLEQITAEELFSPKVYEWTGNNLLRDYINSATASHYRWASKLIRTFSRSLGKG